MHVGLWRPGFHPGNRQTLGISARVSFVTLTVERDPKTVALRASVSTGILPRITQTEGLKNSELTKHLL